MTIPVRWPVAILDFEASGIERLSYPIEVGLARWRGLEAPIEFWSALIKPDPQWCVDGGWSRKAETVHGICREDLVGGTAPAEICLRLNTELSGCLVCSDGYRYDFLWLCQLFDAGGVDTGFELESMIKLAYWANPRFARWLDANKAIRHRAGPDALRLMRGFAYGMGCRPKRVSLP